MKLSFRRTVIPLITALLASLLLIGPSSPAQARSPFCGIRWGSLEKVATALSTAPVTNVRTGRHLCYDRLVIDLAGPVAGYHVAYVPQVQAEGSGFAIPTRGGAALQITVNDPAYNISTGATTYYPANPLAVRNVAGYRTFRQVVWAGSFEGYTSLGLGVRARLPFRVFTLAGPGTSSRLVIDVAHRW
ncbi:MAG TPA: hypothetical protein VGK35_02160 [Actinotalea sp.]|jgi:hypothetical protein